MRKSRRERRVRGRCGKDWNASVHAFTHVDRGERVSRDCTTALVPVLAMYATFISKLL